MQSTNEQYRNISWYLRKRYDRDGRTSFAQLCQIAIFTEVRAQASLELAEAEQKPDEEGYDEVEE